MNQLKDNEHRNLVLRERGSPQLVDLDAEEAALLSKLRTGIKNQPAFELSESHEHSGCFLLQAKGCVGVVRTSKRTILIRPRFCGVPHNENVHLLRLMGYAYGWAEIPFTDHANLDVKEGLFEWLVRVYIHEIHKLLRKGIQKRFITQQEELSYVRGRLLLREHQRLVLNRPGRFPCLSTHHCAATPENLLLQAALEFAGRFCHDINLRSRVKALALEFAAQTTVECVQETPRVDSLDHLHNHYAPAITLAKLVLGKIGPTHAEGDTKSNAFLVDMWHLYERFLQAWFTEHAPEVTGQSSYKIQAAPREQGFSATFKPDYLFKGRGHTELIADAKYKNFTTTYHGQQSLDMPNIHQLVSYTSIFKTDGVLFYPAQPDQNADLRMSLPSGYTIYIRTVAWDRLLDDTGVANELATWVASRRIANADATLPYRS
ncbi:McrC family protein [Desulfovibrio subterraneus]|uniref:McrC family protein n=1 Tax=Desulfovibrio subterraneus TaxID=2718620 RepID=UPI0022B8BC97|nr:hypothetical protein [Desulfovibrio subterraneus]WBF66048.1 McrC family protein [Desulfovibrio subterraneus]